MRVRREETVWLLKPFPGAGWEYSKVARNLTEEGYAS
jgi:hypothetical protein